MRNRSNSALSERTTCIRQLRAPRSACPMQKFLEIPLGDTPGSNVFHTFGDLLFQHTKFFRLLKQVCDRRLAHLQEGDQAPRPPSVSWFSLFDPIIPSRMSNAQRLPPRHLLRDRVLPIAAIESVRLESGEIDAVEATDV